MIQIWLSALYGEGKYTLIVQVFIIHEIFVLSKMRD